MLKKMSDSPKTKNEENSSTSITIPLSTTEKSKERSTTVRIPLHTPDRHTSISSSSRRVVFVHSPRLASFRRRLRERFRGDATTGRTTSNADALLLRTLGTENEDKSSAEEILLRPLGRRRRRGENALSTAHLSVDATARSSAEEFLRRGSAGRRGRTNVPREDQFAHADRSFRVDVEGRFAKCHRTDETAAETSPIERRRRRRRNPLANRSSKINAKKKRSF